MAAEAAVPWFKDMPTNNDEVHYDFSGTSVDGKLQAHAVPEANVWQNQPGTDGEVRYAWGEDGHSIVPAPHLPTYTWMAKAPRKAMLTVLKELSAHTHRSNVASAKLADRRGARSSSSPKQQKLDSMPPFPIPLPPPDGGHVKAPAKKTGKQAALSLQLDQDREAAQKRFGRFLMTSTDKLSTQLDAYFDTLRSPATHSTARRHAATHGGLPTPLFSKFSAPKFSNMERELSELRKGLGGHAGGEREPRAHGQGGAGGGHARFLNSRQKRWLRREHARSLAPLP